MKESVKLETCPLCDEGKLVPRTDRVFRFSYRRKEHRVEGLEHAVCDHCGSSLNLPGQMSRNKAKIDAYQRAIVGDLGPQDIVALREKYMLTQADAALIFGCGPRAFSKWERGEVAPTAATAKLLRLALKSTAVMRAVALDAGVDLDLSHLQDETRSVISRIMSFVRRDALADSDRRVKEAYEAGRRAGATEGARRVQLAQSVRKGSTCVESGNVPEELLWPGREKHQIRVLN